MIGINSIKGTIMTNRKKPLSPSDFRRREKTPLYARLQEKLKGLIQSGYWKPDEQLPTERELASSAGISINTVKTALHNLVLEGYLHRKQGSGTFVSSPEDFFGVHRYYGMQKDFDLPLERHKKTVLSRCVAVVPDEIGRHFGLGEGVEAFRLERLLHVGGVRTIHTVSWLPLKLFEGFDAISDMEIMEDPLYAILAAKFNMPCRVSRELLSVREAPSDIARFLGIAENAPVLYSKLIACTYEDRAFEIRENHIATDNFMLYRSF